VVQGPLQNRRRAHHSKTTTRPHCKLVRPQSFLYLTRQASTFPPLQHRSHKCPLFVSLLAMGVTLSSIMDSLSSLAFWSKSQDVRILMLGLDSAGKTTILYRLQASCPHLPLSSVMIRSPDETYAAVDWGGSFHNTKYVTDSYRTPAFFRREPDAPGCWMLTFRAQLLGLMWKQYNIRPSSSKYGTLAVSLPSSLCTAMVLTKSSDRRPRISRCLHHIPLTGASRPNQHKTILAMLLRKHKSYHFRY
jgi:ADP-ribosylation factor family